MDESNQSAGAANRRWRALAEVLLVWMVFAANGAWPTPDSNEAHYVGKARHYWAPQWITGDLFLDSADTHLVFYTTAGWIADLLPLDAAAWCGRLVTWLLLAWSWRRLSVSLVPRAYWAAATAALFVALNERMHMAGEWVVGGFEAKGFAYALVFFALAEMVEGRWKRVWPLLGGAAAFHVLVGGWSLLAAGVAWLAMPSDRTPLKSMAPSLLVGAALAMFGVWPALAMSWGVDPAVIVEANQLYVFERLRHHLWPPSFPLVVVERNLLMLCLWVAVCAFCPPSLGERRLRWFVGTAATVAVLGMAMAFAGQAYRPEIAAIMRFYWFRLSDAVLPIGLSLGLAAYLARVWQADRLRALILASVAMLLPLWHFADWSSTRVARGTPRPDVPPKTVDPQDWRDACLWIESHTPRDSVFLTPRITQTFKWYAQRNEVVCRKDLPQNPNDIVEWWRRIRDIHATGLPEPEDQWYVSLAAQGESRLRRLAQRYHATHVLTEADPPLALPRLYQNNSYTVYAISP